MGAVLDAATELIADRGPNAVTVRSIAQRAGVNHALVHRHFGSKSDLIRAVVEREQAHFIALADAGGEPFEVIRRLAGSMFERRGYVRFLARSLLDGYRPWQLESVGAFGRVMGVVQGSADSGSADSGSADGGAASGGSVGGDTGEGGAPRPGSADQRTQVAAMAALALGWRIFGGFLARGLSLDEVPEEELDERIVAMITGALFGRPPDQPIP